ncbi:MAG TPA: ribosomal-processing cysteine protease Prp [Candidatus Tumulicola sp.]|nr:ribosomal-processing cysteine protease Prp [Candidatus Tumulicola sp.]
MVEVVFRQDSRQRLSSISARGHAEFAVDADDLVCAAVSAVLQAARLGLEEHAGARLEARQRSGEFFVAWPAARRDDAAVSAIAATARLAIEQLARQYPEHVRCTLAPEDAA